MQERQEFIDRYFVFDQNNAWEPPMDYTRSNGLVEDIRQSILAEEEKARLEEEAKPKKAFTHEPSAPIALPSIGGKSGGGGGGAAGGRDDDAGTGTGAPAATAPATTPRPRIRTPPAGGRAVERVE